MGRASPPILNRAYSALTIKSFDATGRRFAGVATTPKTDRVGDIVEPLGARFKNPLPLLLFHDSKEIVGTINWGTPTKDGIPFTAEIPEVTEEGDVKRLTDKAAHFLKYGLIRAVSIGFHPVADAIEVIKTGFRYREWEGLETSLIPIPANTEALIHTIKSFDSIASIDAPELAETGETARLHTPGDTGTRVVRIGPTKAPPMKTYQERIASVEATIAAKSAELEAVQTKVSDEGRTKDATERESFDTLKADVVGLTAELADLREMEKINITKAVPVAGTAPAAASAAREGVAVTVRETLPPGIGFARAVKACIVARIDGRNMLDVAKEMYPSDQRLHGHLAHVLNLPNIVAQMKAAVPGGTTTNTTWASALVDPTNLASEFIEFLRPATIIGKFGTGIYPSLRQVPFNVRMIEQTQGGTGYWVGQGAPKPLTAFGYSPVTLAFTKVAAISVITEELARFSSPSAEMLTRDGLRDALVERIDRDFIDPAEAGTANVQPASVTNGLTALSSAGVSADNARTDLANIMGDFVGANLDPAGVVLIMPTALALALSFKVNSLGQPEFPGLNMTGGTINGLPVITSQYAANASGGGNLVIAVNAREVFLADDGQVTIDASREASLQMLDNPTNNSATAVATTMVSMWQTNSIALRAERFINWSKRRTDAVVYMDDVNWGSIGSP